MVNKQKLNAVHFKFTAWEITNKKRDQTVTLEAYSVKEVDTEDLDTENSGSQTGMMEIYGIVKHKYSSLLSSDERSLS